MQLSLTVHKPHWKQVFSIPQSTVLQKGRHGIYSELVEAAGSVTARFGCYSWATANAIHYCGSFSQDYKGGKFRSNLHARVHNYWQNHNEKASGHKNTNLMVFENIALTLKTEPVNFQVFSFEGIEFGDKHFSPPEFAQDSDMVHVVEQLLIATYRKRGECSWNRT